MNNQFTPFYYPNYQTYQQPAQQNTDERIWVQNETGADAFMVVPNGFVRLWNSNENVFYEKSADNTGRTTITTYEYKKREPNIIDSQKNEYITKEDFELFKNQIEERINVLCRES